MRLVRMEGNSVISVIEAPDPVPSPGEVVVETAVSALCGSELHAYRGAGEKKGNSGHEAAGTVAFLGEGVIGLRVGQRVGVSAVAGCGACPFCAKGQYTWCPDLKVYANTHADRFLAAARACHPLPDDVSWETGALISGDGLGVAFHTNARIPIKEVATVAVFGVGPIGLGHVLLQTYLGRRVMAVDVAAARLDFATKLGAAAVVDAGQADAVARIRELTNGAGADLCIEAAGRPETAKQCFAAARTGGAVAFNGEQPAVELSPSGDFIRRDITAFGAWFYHFSEFPAMLALCRQGLSPERLVTHRFPLAQAADGFAAFAAGLTGKVLLTTGQGESGT